MKRNAFLIVLVIMAGWVRANHWEPNTHLYNSYTIVTAVVQIDGTEQQRTDLELGAFCGSEVRGSKYAQQFGPTGRYLFRLSCWGDPGDEFYFKLYDANLDEELTCTCDVTLSYSSNPYGGIASPYVLNFTNSVTFSLDISGYGNSQGGYYLIATPINNINPDNIEGMTSGDFDLYYFDQREADEWRNYKDTHFNLESGKGYLYAHKTDTTLNFTGTPYDGDGQVSLLKKEGVPFTGWNLVGNPFVQTATIGDKSFYVMKDDGTEIIPSVTKSIAAMQGIFVIASEDGETLTFSTEGNTEQSPMLVINVQQGRHEPIDRAIVRFEGNSNLPKFMLNPNSTKVYLPQDGADYAVTSHSTEHSSPVSFKARENGNYTLSVDVVNLDLDYLHLVDSKTGADINLLQTPCYTFEASITDEAERFRLVYATTTGIDETDKPFAFYVDGEIRLIETCHGASLQIADINGHIVLSTNAARNVSTSGMAPGVYMLSLINGKDVKVQKVVVE